MNNHETPPSLRREQELFERYLAAENEVQAIFNEINKILGSTKDRSEAERILLQTHANRLEQAVRKSRELLIRWLEEIKKP